MLTPIATSLFLAFTPPSNFEQVKPSVEINAEQTAYLMKGRSGFVPSINHTHKKTTSSLTDFVAKVRKLYKGDRSTQFSELGTIKTAFGQGQLCQIEGKTEWGPYTSLQAYVIKGGELHILTGCALTSDYTEMMPIFLTSFTTQ